MLAISTNTHTNNLGLNEAVQINEVEQTHT